MCELDMVINERWRALQTPLQANLHAGWLEIFSPLPCVDIFTAVQDRNPSLFPLILYQPPPLRLPSRFCSPPSSITPVPHTSVWPPLSNVPSRGEHRRGRAHVNTSHGSPCPPLSCANMGSRRRRIRCVSLPPPPPLSLSLSLSLPSHLLSLSLS